MDLLPLLIAFFNEIDVLMLIMTRVLAFLILVPVLSGMAIPMIIRLTLAFALSLALFATGLMGTATYHDSAVGFIILIVQEFMTGAVMGFVVFFVFNILLFAGQFIDFSMGLAMANVMDPIQQIQVPVMGNLLFLMANAFLVVTGGLHAVLRVFFDSYRVLPMGSASIIDNASLAQFMVVQMVSFLTVAVSVAIPIVGTMLVVDVCLGIMVKAVPQMNVFVVGMPLKVLLGFILVFAIMVPSFNLIYDNVFYRAFNMLESTVNGMIGVE
jgi:flagellar biosynthetic protein FliR